MSEAIITDQTEQVKASGARAYSGEPQENCSTEQPTPSDLVDRPRPDETSWGDTQYSIAVANTIREALLIVDDEFRIHAANLSFLTTFYLSKDEVMQRSLFEVGEGRWDIPQLRALLGLAISENKPFEKFEVEQDFPQVGWRSLLISSHRLSRGAGRNALILLEIDDITALKRAERNLDASEKRQAILAGLGEQLRDLKVPSGIMHTAMKLVATTLSIDSAGFGVIESDGDSITIENSWTNSRAHAVDGQWSLKDFGQHLASKLLEGKTISITDATCDPLTVGKEQNWAAINVQASVNVPLMRDGRLIALFFFNHSEPYYWTPDDIRFLEKVADRTWASVERERLSQEREKLTEELSRSNEELAQFAHLAAHDLQAPLRGVISHTQLLERKLDGLLGLSETQCLDEIISSARRMEELVRSLLQFAQVSHEKPEQKSVSMQRVLAVAIKNLTTQIAECQAEISSVLLPTIAGNEIQLVQVVQNLISNALKYSRPEAPPKISICCHTHGDEYTFEVQDNGRGIAPQHFHLIFDPWKRLHGAEIPGTGLGLSASARIIERHGGKMRVESQIGTGSRFFFSLPRAFPELAVSAS